MTEDACALDVRRLQREGLLSPGRVFGLEWPGVGTRYFRVASSLGSLHHVGESLGALPLTWTTCTYGGMRPWFQCPGQDCGRRVALLYSGPAFLCRHCLRLTFRSQRLDSIDRAVERVQSLRKRLGGAPVASGPRPPRPKGMHEWTYTRLGIAVLSAELRASRAILSRFGEE